MVLKKKAVTTRRRIEYVPPAWVVRGFAIEAEGTVLDAPHVATVLKRVMTEDCVDGDLCVVRAANPPRAKPAPCVPFDLATFAAKRRITLDR
jgi:hypothetical protein